MLRLHILNELVDGAGKEGRKGSATNLVCLGALYIGAGAVVDGLNGSDDSGE